MLSDVPLTWSASTHHVISVIIRRRVVVASAMLTRRAGVGSAEARMAGANGARVEVRMGGLEQKLGSRTRAGSAESWRCDSILSFL